MVLRSWFVVVLFLRCGGGSSYCELMKLGLKFPTQKFLTFPAASFVVD